MTDTTLHGDDAMAVSFLSRAANAIVEASQLAREVAALRSQVEHLEHAVATLREQKDHAEERINQLVEDRSSAQSKAFSLGEEVTHLRRDVDSVKWERDQNWSALGQARELIVTLTDAGDSAQQLADYRQGEIDRITAENRELRAERTRLQDDNEMVSRLLRIAEDERDEARGEVARLGAALTQAEDKLEQIAGLVAPPAREVEPEPVAEAISGYTPPVEWVDEPLMVRTTGGAGIWSGPAIAPEPLADEPTATVENRDVSWQF